MKRMALALIDFYRSFLSSFFGVHCRFAPSCSAYAREAIETFGFFRGGLMALSRLSRCHPFGGHGFDPVETISSQEKI